MCPPGGANTRDEGRPVMTWAPFMLEPEAKALLETNCSFFGACTDDAAAGTTAVAATTGFSFSTALTIGVSATVMERKNLSSQRDVQRERESHNEKDSNISICIRITCKSTYLVPWALPSWPAAALHPVKRTFVLPGEPTPATSCVPFGRGDFGCRSW